MAGRSKIEWTDATWNPIVGCSIVSPGCTNCYAMKMAARLGAIAEANTTDKSRPQHYLGVTHRVNDNAVWTGAVTQAPVHILLAPLRWKKPRHIFVNSMGDLFHEMIPDEWIDSVFAVMALCPQHTFQVLTKRAARTRDYFAAPHRANWSGVITKFIAEGRFKKDDWTPAMATAAVFEARSPPNVWLGVSAERQQEADERIPPLLNTPATVRFVSCEPLLGPIDLRRWIDPACGVLAVPSLPRLDWVIVGGEKGEPTCIGAIEDPTTSRPPNACRACRPILIFPVSPCEKKSARWATPCRCRSAAPSPRRSSARSAPPARPRHDQASACSRWYGLCRRSFRLLHPSGHRPLLPRGRHLHCKRARPGRPACRPEETFRPRRQRGMWTMAECPSPAQSRRCLRVMAPNPRDGHIMTDIPIIFSVPTPPQPRRQPSDTRYTLGQLEQLRRLRDCK